MRFADCVPVLLHDPVRRVIGLAHAGWLGTIRGVARSAIENMQKRYGSEPRDILAAIGPSIGPDHYEVGQDVIQKIEESFGEKAEGLVGWRDGRSYLDLWKANRLQLEQAGVQQIEVAEVCTACHLEDWFSHRAEKGKTGRFGAIMALD
jgi:YfiH family protein